MDKRSAPFALQMNLLPVRVSGIRLPRLPSLQRSFVTLPSRRTIKPISALLIKRYQWEILTITSPQNQLILCIRVPQKDLCIATKPMFDFRIPKPGKRLANPKPLLTLVLFWTGKGHYRRYFYVRPLQKIVSKGNCGGHFLRNTSRIVKKTLTLIMLVTTTIILSQEGLADYMLTKKKQKRRLTAATYEQNIEVPFWIFESSAAEYINYNPSVRTINILSSANVWVTALYLCGSSAS